MHAYKSICTYMVNAGTLDICWGMVKHVLHKLAVSTISPDIHSINQLHL